MAVAKKEHQPALRDGSGANLRRALDWLQLGVPYLSQKLCGLFEIRYGCVHSALRITEREGAPQNSAKLRGPATEDKLQQRCGEDIMPEKKTLERARKDAKEGKSPSTQAGEFVHEEI